MRTRGTIQPRRPTRNVSELLTCCVPKCRCLGAISNAGYLLPCCKPHADQLPEKLFREAERLAAFSPYDPQAVLESMLVVVAIVAFYDPKRGGIVRTRRRYR